MTTSWSTKLPTPGTLVSALVKLRQHPSEPRYCAAHVHLSPITRRHLLKLLGHQVLLDGQLICRTRRSRQHAQAEHSSSDTVSIVVSFFSSRTIVHRRVRSRLECSRKVDGQLLDLSKSKIVLLISSSALLSIQFRCHVQNWTRQDFNCEKRSYWTSRYESLPGGIPAQGNYA